MPRRTYCPASPSRPPQQDAVGAAVVVHRGEAGAGLAPGRIEQCVQPVPLVGDLDPLEGRRHQTPGLVEGLLELEMTLHHAGVGVRHVHQRPPVELRRPPVEVVGGDVAPLFLEPRGQRLVLLGRAGPFGVPTVEVIRLVAARHFPDVRVRMQQGRLHAHLELAAAGKARSGKEALLQVVVGQRPVRGFLHPITPESGTGFKRLLSPDSTTRIRLVVQMP